MSEQDTRIVYCFANRALPNDSEQGSLIPIIEETPDGLVRADPEVYVNNGKIHVTRGYQDKFASLPENTIFKVEATVSRAWDDTRKGLSKFVTFDRVSAPAAALVICMVIETDYPDPTIQDGMRCSSAHLPVDLFFIRCTNLDGNSVLVGPLSVILGSEKNDNGYYIFDYRAPDRPFGGEWSKVNEASHATMLFELDLISDGSIISTQGQDFLVNLEQLPFLSAVLVDLSSNENVIKWAAKLLRQSGSGLGSKISVIKEIVEKIPNDIDLPDYIYESRRSRLKNIEDSLSKIEGFSQILADYMKSDDGQHAIKQHVEVNRDRLLEMYSHEALGKEIGKAKDEAEKYVADSTKRIAQLKVTEEELNETIEVLKSSEAGLQIDSLQTKINTLRDERNIILEVDELKMQKKIIEQDIRAIDNDKEKAETLLLEIQANIGNTEESHKLKLIELKMG